MINKKDERIQADPGVSMGPPPQAMPPIMAPQAPNPGLRPPMAPPAAAVNPQQIAQLQGAVQGGGMRPPQASSPMPTPPPAAPMAPPQGMPPTPPPAAPMAPPPAAPQGDMTSMMAPPAVPGQNGFLDTSAGSAQPAMDRFQQTLMSDKPEDKVESMDTMAKVAESDDPAAFQKASPAMQQVKQQVDSKFKVGDYQGHEVYECPGSQAPCSRKTIFQRLKELFLHAVGRKSREEYDAEMAHLNSVDPITRQFGANHKPPAMPGGHHTAERHGLVNGPSTPLTPPPNPMQRDIQGVQAAPIQQGMGMPTPQDTPIFNPNQGMA